MKTLVILLVAFTAFCCATKWSELESYNFEAYKAEFNKIYRSNEEEAFRRQIFEKNLEDIKAHNLDSTRSWKKGVNHLADWTEQEYKRLLGGRKHLLTPSQTKAQNIDVSHLEGTNKDWRTDNIVTAVKDQGMCGSCWSFASAENLESYWAQKHKQLVVLSEQQIIDCTPNSDDCGGTGGCNGATAELAYTQIMKTGGLSTEWVYPYMSYTNTTRRTCQTGVTTFASIVGFKNLPSNDYAAVLKHIGEVGTLAVNVDAMPWQFYENGVFDGCTYDNVDIDHVVQLVGFGTDPQNGDYWLVRNSWAPNWGELGYIRLKRDSKCGVDKTPSDGTGCNGGPSKVTVCGQCGILYDTLYPIVA